MHEDFFVVLNKIEKAAHRSMDIFGILFKTTKRFSGIHAKIQLSSIFSKEQRLNSPYIKKFIMIVNFTHFNFNWLTLFGAL